MLDAGRLVRSGPLVPTGATGSIAVEIVGDPAAFVARLSASGLAVEQEGVRLVVTADGDDAFDRIRDAAAGAGVGIVRLGRAVATLEDEFLHSARGEHAR